MTEEQRIVEDIKAAIDELPPAERAACRLFGELLKVQASLFGAHVACLAIALIGAELAAQPGDEL